MPGGPAAIKLLVDEDLSPKVAQRLRAEDGIDAIAAIEFEHAEGRDIVNRALRIGIDGTKAFEAVPVDDG